VKQTALLFSHPVVVRQIILLLTIGASVGLVLGYLHWRGRLGYVRPWLIPAALFAVFGSLDAWVTMSGTWNAPWREGNPSIRVFMEWGGWWGQCVATAAWIVGWSLFVVGLGTLGRRLPGRWGTLVSYGPLLTLYALALGHLDGLLSWTDSPAWLAGLFLAFERFLREKAAWLAAVSPFGMPLYTGLFLGGICAVLHCWIDGVAGALKRNAGQGMAGGEVSG
jgi:hypothetical protein